MILYGSADAPAVVLCKEEIKLGIEHSHYIGANDEGKLIDRAENLACSCPCLRNISIGR